MNCWYKYKMVWLLWKIVWWFLKKLNTESPHDSAIHSGYFRRTESRVSRDSCAPRLVAVLLSTSRAGSNPSGPWWMNRETKRGTYRTLFILQQEVDSDTGYTADEPRGHYATWNEPVTKMLSTAWFYLHEVLEPSSSRTLKSEWWFTGRREGWGII